MSEPRARRRPMHEINVVPYIDVMLVLLVIFMITAPLLTQGVQVELPQANAESIDTQTLEPVVVTVDAGGAYYIDIGDDPDVSVDPATLVARVAAVLRHRPGTPVYVRGDKSVHYGAVVSAMVLLQKAGVPGVGLITEMVEE
ncbi:MAG: protein TolR [Gammaproteobacteria bacterium]|nr:protein TolR [Gammaproteobacteria bacterium]